jgi:hypothetical protein
MRTRSVAAVLAGLAAAVALQVGGASPAHACSCAVDRSDAVRAVNADAVFVGRVAAERRSGRNVTWTVDVETVVKGEVARRQAVRSAGDGASCGAGLNTDGWYLVLADLNPDGTLSTGLCSGNRDVPAHFVPTAFGAVTTPRPGSAGRVDSGVPWPLLLGVAAALAAVTGGLLAAGRRRA